METVVLLDVTAAFTSLASHCLGTLRQCPDTPWASSRSGFLFSHTYLGIGKAPGPHLSS